MRKMLLGAAAAVAALTAAGQAQALTFVLNDTGGTAAGTQARNGFVTAAAYWSSVLTDNVTVNLNIGFQSLGQSILGQTSSRLFSTSLTNYYAALSADRTSNLDNLAVSSLQPLVNGAITVVTPGYVDPTNKLGADTTTFVVDFDGSANNSGLIGTSANLKALGFGLPSGVDGTVVFNSDLPFDFDPTDGVTSRTSDFIGVAIHEIGHALGFVSGVDTYDYYGEPRGSGKATGDTLNFNNSRVNDVLDLYRYSAPGVIDWRPGVNSYFSIDGGATQFNGRSGFSTGTQNGDGYQASHWKAPTDAQGNFTCSVTFIGIMNPYLCGGQQGVVTGTDLAAFDAIGWNLKFDVLSNPNYRFTTAQAYQAFAPAPEPATWAMMIVGFGVVGGSVRQQRRRAKVSFA